MEKSNFDQLLQRYLTGQVSEQEKIKIEAWLDVMKTESITDLELSKTDEDKLFQKIITNRDTVKEVIDFRPEKTMTSAWMLKAAAAILVVALVISYGVWYKIHKNLNESVVASRNGVEKIILNDGTLAWLRGKSTLVYYDKPEEGIRYSELVGEALFEVAKDAKHPFLIKCGDVTIRVVGTSFSLRTRNDSLELKVLTGRVKLSSENDKTGVEVEPNQKVIYTGTGGIRKLALGENEISSIVANTEYSMQFVNATIGDVTRRIGEKFNVDVRVVNAEINKCRINADFTDRSLESTLQMITEVLDVSYTKNGSSIIINGKGCQ